MGMYRVEISPSSRAKCHGGICDKSEKIKKGELRLGTWFDPAERGWEGHACYQWKHWGEITPLIIKNIKASVSDDLECLDGYAELEDEEMAEKVRFAFEHGHIPDEDWMGRFRGSPLLTPLDRRRALTALEGEEWGRTSKKKIEIEDVESQSGNEIDSKLKANAKAKQSIKSKAKAGKKFTEEEDDETSSFLKAGNPGTLEPDEQPKPKGRNKAAKKQLQDEDDTSFIKIEPVDPGLELKTKGRKKAAKKQLKDEDDSSLIETDPVDDEPEQPKAKGRDKKAAKEQSQGEDVSQIAEPEQRGNPKRAAAEKFEKVKPEKEDNFVESNRPMTRSRKRAFGSFMDFESLTNKGAQKKLKKKAGKVEGDMKNQEGLQEFSQEPSQEFSQHYYNAMADGETVNRGEPNGAATQNNMDDDNTNGSVNEIGLIHGQVNKDAGSNGSSTNGFVKFTASNGYTDGMDFENAEISVQAVVIPGSR